MLQDNLGLGAEVAQWAVTTWASALDITVSASVPQDARRDPELVGRLIRRPASVDVQSKIARY